MSSNRKYLKEKNIYGEVIVSIMVNKSNPNPLLKSVIDNKGVLCTNAWIINNKIGLQIKYSLIPENKSDWTHFTYEFHDSDPILKFDNNLNSFLCLFAIDDDVKARGNHLFYLPFDKQKYYPYSKSKLSISLFVKKGHYPIVKIYFGQELVDKIKPWKKLPDILFQ